ncbi:MAG: carboxypeptidase M32, partial [Solobacterium sp.]|nr:carboxypeptidase M32 [Solobacterium sp.]
MTDNQNYKEYKDWIFKTSAYQMALSLISIDKLTVAPSGGNSYRDERTAFLAGELFAMETDPHIIEVLKALKDDPAISDDDRKAVS